MVGDVAELVVFGAGVELGTERHEEGNLELDLVSINPIEDAVEAGVFQSFVESVAHFGLFGEGFFGGLKRVFLLLATGFGDVGGDLVGAAGQSAGEGNADRTEARGFDEFVVIFDGFVEVVGAGVNLGGETGDFLAGVAHGAADDNESDESQESAAEDFEN